MGLLGGTEIRFLSSARQQLMRHEYEAGLMHCIVSLFTLQLIVPTHREMARLS